MKKERSRLISVVDSPKFQYKYHPKTLTTFEIKKSIQIQLRKEASIYSNTALYSFMFPFVYFLLIFLLIDVSISYVISLCLV